ncbi:hypothetical protein C0J52_17105, partial [Blattella germanica]
ILANCKYKKYDFLGVRHLSTCVVLGAFTLTIETLCRTVLLFRTTLPHHYRNSMKKNF